MLAATLKGPGLAPGTRLINDLENQDAYGVSGQQPPPIFRPERASPQGIPRADKEEVRDSRPRTPHPGCRGESPVTRVSVSWPGVQIRPCWPKINLARLATLLLCLYLPRVGV